MEPEEINEFSNKMKEAGEGGESVKVISLAISILAVLVAMVTVLGHRSHTEAVLSQSRAGDMWNEYQAKKIRSYQIGVEMDLLGLQPNSNGEAVEKKLGEDRSLQGKWKEELIEQQDKAREFEADVAHAEKQALRFDIGEALLQIAVVLCSVTLFTRRRLYFIMGLGLGVAGLIAASSALLVK
jgi:hypothetical protein